jgi:hypothetical protein
MSLAVENGIGNGRWRCLARSVRLAVECALWCGWGYAGCGFFPAWRQGWRGLPLVVACVLASFAILFASALLLQFAAVPLTRNAWLGAMTGLGLLACLLPGRERLAAESPIQCERQGRWVAVLLAVAATFSLAVIAYRAIAQPLTGPDTIFRWNFLARQILTARGIGFYPPVSDADFGTYMWPDGIPPLLSLLYVWSYMGAGSAVPADTAIVVCAVGLLDFVLVGMIAARVGGWTAGAWALAALAGSSLFSWSVSMGQETGLTTLGTLALAWAIGREKPGPDWRLAGLAAGVTALSRDYGLAVAAAGAGYLAWRRRPWRELAGYSAVAAAIFGPWYARNWVRTGNPIYNLSPLGLFPVNETHAGMMRSYVPLLGFGGHMAERLRELGPLLWPVGCGVLFAALAAVRVLGAWPVSLRWLSALWLALWLWSVGYTAGGISYSLRVLDPLLAMLAVSGGIALSRAPRNWRAVLACCLVVISAEASARALVMMRVPTGIPLASWTGVGDSFSAKTGDPSHDRAAAMIGKHAVFVDDADAHAFLALRGTRVVPPWAPELDFLRAPDIEMASAVRRMRALGIDYMWLSASRETRNYFGRFRFFDELDPWVRPVLNGDGWVLFSLVQPPDDAVGPRGANPSAIR